MNEERMADPSVLTVPGISFGRSSCAEQNVSILGVDKTVRGHG